MTLRSKKGEDGRLTLANEKRTTRKTQDRFQLRGVIYARYSNGGNQTDQSLEGQVRDCREYADEHNIRIVEEYLDAHISGKDAENRAEFQRMIADSGKGNFDIVIVWKTDRFARNRYDAARYKEHLKRNGIIVRYAKESIPDGAEGIILESMLEGTAEYYSVDLREKIERGMMESAFKCKALTYPPIGYRINSEKKYEIDEVEAPLVRSIFDMYIRGDKLSDIAEKMNALGLRTKGHNNPLRGSSITKIIENEKYIGVYEYKKGGIRIEDGIPAIIPKDIFYAAQERKKAQAYGTYSKKNYSKASKRIYPLAGLVLCGECGSPMFGETVTKFKGTEREYSNSYYSCRGHRKKSIVEKCPKKSVPAASLESIVKDVLLNVFLKDYIVDTLSETVDEITFTEDHAVRIKQLQSEKQKKEKAIQNNLTLIDNSLYTTAIVTHLKRLEADLAVIDKEIRLCQTSDSTVRHQLFWLIKNYHPTEECEEDEYWNDMFHCFIDSVVCFEDGTILINLKLNSIDGKDTNSNEGTNRWRFRRNIHDYIRKTRIDKRRANARAKPSRLHSISATFQLIKRLIGCRFLLFEII